MMYVEIVHAETGRRFLVPALQAAVFAESGHPVAVTYEHANLLVHSDAAQKDFDSVCKQLQVKKIDPSG